MDEQPIDSGSELADATAVVIAKLRGTKRAIGDLEVVKLQQVVEWVVPNQVEPVTHERVRCVIGRG